jgi:hypothetical protein
MLGSESPTVAAATQTRARIRFRHGRNSAFYQALVNRADTYFAQSGKSRYADWTCLEQRRGDS